jgi:predicted dehydrogenase
MKIGVVGYGSIGQRHAENARKLGHQVVVYDPAASSDYRFERLLYDDKSVDAVVVATPSMFHEGPLRACVERGKHVLIEKPISTGVGALPELLRVAAEKRLVVMMGNNLRFHPCVLQATQWIESGVRGAPCWANFTCATEQTQTALRDGVILNTGAHEVDVALHLLGPAVVLTATTSHDISADFVLQHDGGVRSTFHIDIDTPNRIRHFLISCRDGHIGADLDSRLIRSMADQRKMAGTYADDYMTEMRAFVERIEGKRTLGATGEDGLEVLRLLLDIRSKAGVAPQ